MPVTIANTGTFNPAIAGTAAGLAAGSAAGLTASVTTGTLAPLQPASGHAYFGAYPGAGNASPVTFESAVMGSSRLLKTYLRYYAFSSGTFPTAADETLMAAGRIPVFSLQNQFGTTYTITWAAVAGGSNDTQLSSIAAAVQAGGQPCFIEYEAEPDDGGKIGGGGTLGSAADYVSAFQHVSTVLRAGAPGLIATCWTVSGGNSTSQPTYPGDAYVDWICVDPYDSTLSKGSATNTCSPFVTWLNTDPLAVGGGSGSGGGHGKPLGIMETGVQDSEPDASIAAWLQGGGSYGTGVPAALAALSTTWGSRYQTWNWFNSSGTLGTDTIKTDGSMPLTIAAMQAIGAAPVFS